MTEAECEDESVEETTYLAKLMAYCSREAHSCVEKAAMIGFVKVKTHTLPKKKRGKINITSNFKLRILEPDENCSLRGETLRQAMQEDMENGWGICSFPIKYTYC